MKDQNASLAPSNAPTAKRYDSTLARIAGNVASGLVSRGSYDGDVSGLAQHAVAIAKEIVQALQAPEAL